MTANNSEVGRLLSAMNRHSLPRSRRPEAAGRILAAIARAQEIVSATPKARMAQ
jgi:hypothetical protein